MLCQNCHNGEITVRIFQKVNNVTSAVSLCQECAESVGFHSPLEDRTFPLEHMLKIIFEGESLPSPHTETDLMCPNCFLTYEEFTRRGMFGCGECYNAFREVVRSIMNQLHGSAIHKGKIPRATSHLSQSLREEEQLQSELRMAIEVEDYERAAELRDELRRIGSQSVPST